MTNSPWLSNALKEAALSHDPLNTLNRLGWHTLTAPSWREEIHDDIHALVLTGRIDDRVVTSKGTIATYLMEFAADGDGMLACRREVLWRDYVNLLGKHLDVLP